MEKQKDFLSTLDKKTQITGPSPLELKLEELLKSKELLSREIDACPVCDGRSRGVCGQNHKERWRQLLKDIDQLELDLRG